MHMFTLQLATCVGIKYSYCKIISYYHIANVYQLADMFIKPNITNYILLLLLNI